MAESMLGEAKPPRAVLLDGDCQILMALYGKSQAKCLPPCPKTVPYGTVKNKQSTWRSGFLKSGSC
jgi:hypothetical protein